MKTESLWPKAPTYWQEGRTLYVSVPFSWNMPGVREKLSTRSYLWDQAVIGGPGAYLVQHFYPDYLQGLPVTIGDSYPGVLQRVNAMVTRTTASCIWHCEFCGVGCGLIEPGEFRVLKDAPDLPIYADNNVLAAPVEHFDWGMDRLEKHGWGDFEQGVDCRLLTEHHAERIKRIPGLIVRLALDSKERADMWTRAYERLRSAGLAKRNIRSYALIGFDFGPAEAWERCRWIEGHGVKPLPMWFHRLDALDCNVVTKEQADMGWTDYERRRIMQWFYQHKEAVPA